MRTRTITRIVIAVAVLVTSVAGINLAAADGSSKPAPVLDGAKVYAANCGSCHSERWPNERSDREWKIIVMHMKVRANLTGAESDAVLKYLQNNNKDTK